METTAKMLSGSRPVCLLLRDLESDLLINLCAFSRGTTRQTVCSG
jgi:hypothetical protein